MSSLVQYPDVPCSYPNSLTQDTVATNVGNTPVVLAVFQNNSSVANLRGILQRFNFVPFNPTNDTLLHIHMVGFGTPVGGSFAPIGGYSLFDINTTATDYTGGTVALTMFDYVVLGNKTQPSSLSSLDASALGLELPVGQSFAIVAHTEAVGESVDIAWTVNWLEKD